MLTVLRRSRGLQWTIAKYAAVCAARMSTNLAYVGETVVRTLFLAIVLYIFAQLWRVTFSGLGAHRIAGFTVAQMLWYLVITEAITLSRPTVNVDIDEDVRTGSLASALSRPYHYLAYQVANHLGDRLWRIAINLLLGGMVAVLIVGPIRMTAQGLIATAAATILAVLVDYMGVLCVALLAFWIEDTSSVALLYSRVTMILGGLLMPLDVFPTAIAHLCRMLPFSGIYYLPGRLFAGGLPHDVGWLLLRQLAWLAIGAGTALAIYNKGVARVETNGG
jgi:ABC-2 type transport system permease protein